MVRGKGRGRMDDMFIRRIREHSAMVHIDVPNAYFSTKFMED